MLAILCVIAKESMLTCDKFLFYLKIKDIKVTFSKQFSKSLMYII